MLLYTGTTGFRHTDGINGGRPVVQTALETAGYTVDWEDCTNNGGGATNCDNANKNPRIFTDENLARYDAIVLLNSSAGPPGPLVVGRPEGVDHQVRPERRRHRRHAQRDGHGHHGRDVELVGRQQRQLGRRRHDGAATPPPSPNNIGQVQVADHNHLATRDLPDTVRLR